MYVQKNGLAKQTRAKNKTCKNKATKMVKLQITANKKLLLKKR